MNLIYKAQKIKAVILDIDGVLTDATFAYGDHIGEVKSFNVKDGHGIKLLRRAGLIVGLISGRSSEANRKRAKELQLDFIYENQKNKLEAFYQILKEYKLEDTQCLYMGDDLIDIPVMREAAIGIAVADAVKETKNMADIITENKGGHGAVREMAEWLLKAQEKWESVIARYFKGY